MPQLRVMRSKIAVATLLEPHDRERLDAAARGRFHALHADSLQQVVRSVREQPVHAVFLSPSKVPASELPAVASFVGRFPGVPAVAFVSRHDRVSSERLLQLGSHGVRQILDLTGREGWQRLRDLVSHPATPTAAVILARVIPELGETTHSCRRFFQILIRLAPDVSTVKLLARYLSLEPSTFMSRFFRAGLPTPKRYLAAVRLLYAAALLRSRGLSISDVAHQLDYSSPQSFGRHVKNSLGLTASEFRRRYSLHTAIDDFITRLIVPFRAALRTFTPLDDGMGDPGAGWWRAPGAV
ncbi:MAG: helix-turn-helix transcriptional regulator [Gemmatimonadales bacterium]